MLLSFYFHIKDFPGKLQSILDPHQSIRQGLLLFLVPAYIQPLAYFDAVFNQPEKVLEKQYASRLNTD